MPVITRENSEIVIEIDESGVARMYVAGVFIPSTGIDMEFATRHGGEIHVTILARHVTVKSVKSRKITPKEGAI